MLLLFNRFNDIDIPQLMTVYQLPNNAINKYGRPDPNMNNHLWMKENELLNYLRESMRDQLLYCAVWAPDGQYKSVLRLERYNNGYLIAGLETAVQERGRGYAKALLRAVLSSFPGTQLYSHIALNNEISIHVHTQCGFRKILDYAKYLDGSISRFAGTFYIET